MKDPGSKLATFFSGIHEQNRTSDGKVFLDRDPETFKHVLSYLRNDFSIAPFTDKFLEKQFEAELAFWNLKPHKSNKLSDSIKQETKKTTNYIQLKSLFASDPKSTSKVAQKKW